MKDRLIIFYFILFLVFQGTSLGLLIAQDSSGSETEQNSSPSNSYQSEGGQEGETESGESDAEEEAARDDWDANTDYPTITLECARLVSPDGSWKESREAQASRCAKDTLTDEFEKTKKDGKELKHFEAFGNTYEYLGNGADLTGIGTSKNIKGEREVDPNDHGGPKGFRDENGNIDSNILDRAFGISASKPRNDLRTSSSVPSVGKDFSIDAPDGVPAVGLSGDKNDGKKIPDLPDGLDDYAASRGFDFKAGITLAAKISVGFIPWLNDASDFYEVTVGYDSITGEKLDVFDRILSGLGLFAGSGQLYRSGLKWARKSSGGLIDRLKKITIETPYEAVPVKQEISKKALDVWRRVHKTRRVYRRGDYNLSRSKAGADPALDPLKSQPFHWFPDPSDAKLSPQAFAKKYGTNNFEGGVEEFLEIGEIVKGAKFITIKAGALSGNLGGGIEVVVHPKDVRVIYHGKP